MKKSKILKSLLADIQTNIPAKEGYYYHIDHSIVYGGYRLVLVKSQGGGHHGCFGDNGCESRLPYKHFETKLRTIISTYRELQVLGGAARR